MNRQMKRAQERAEKQQRRAPGGGGDGSATTGRRQATGPGGARPTPGVSTKRKRTGARQFLREVRLELKKVDWPTRKELVTYTVVVLVTITVLTVYVFGLDSVFERAIFTLLD
jgi:preprotein translocase subunit SecE